MEPLDILREQAKVLTPVQALVARWYVVSHLRLSDYWRSALALTLDSLSATATAPSGVLLDLYFGTPDAWSDVMRKDIDAFDLRVWLSGVRVIADRYDVLAPQCICDRSA